jgi:hypothetical protein
MSRTCASSAITNEQVPQKFARLILETTRDRHLILFFYPETARL